MAQPAMDTHRLFKKLTAAGISEAAAEVLVEAVVQRHVDVATKGDLARLRQEIKVDMDGLRRELTGLRHELKADIASARLQIVCFMIPSMAALLAIFKYF